MLKNKIIISFKQIIFLFSRFSLSKRIICIQQFVSCLSQSSVIHFKTRSVPYLHLENLFWVILGRANCDTLRKMSQSIKKQEQVFLGGKCHVLGVERDSTP